MFSILGRIVRVANDVVDYRAWTRAAFPYARAPYRSSSTHPSIGSSSSMDSLADMGGESISESLSDPSPSIERQNLEKSVPSHNDIQQQQFRGRSPPVNSVKPNIDEQELLQQHETIINTKGGTGIAALTPTTINTAITTTLSPQKQQIGGQPKKQEMGMKKEQCIRMINDIIGPKGVVVQSPPGRSLGGSDDGSNNSAPSQSSRSSRSFHSSRPYARNSANNNNSSNASSTGNNNNTNRSNNSSSSRNSPQTYTQQQQPANNTENNQKSSSSTFPPSSSSSSISSNNSKKIRKTVKKSSSNNSNNSSSHHNNDKQT